MANGTWMTSNQLRTSVPFAAAIDPLAVLAVFCSFQINYAFPAIPRLIVRHGNSILVITNVSKKLPSQNRNMGSGVGLEKGV